MKKKSSEFSDIKESEFDLKKITKKVKTSDEKISEIKAAELQNEKTREGLFETEHYLNIYFNTKKQRDSFLEILGLIELIEDKYFINGMSFVAALQDNFEAVKTIYDKMNVRGSYIETPKCFQSSPDADFDIVLTADEQAEYENLMSKYTQIIHTLRQNFLYLCLNIIQLWANLRVLPSQKGQLIMQKVYNQLLRLYSPQKRLRTVQSEKPLQSAIHL